jgi:hypothetical protein
VPLTFRLHPNQEHGRQAMVNGLPRSGGMAWFAFGRQMYDEGDIMMMVMAIQHDSSCGCAFFRDLVSLISNFVG